MEVWPIKGYQIEVWLIKVYQITSLTNQSLSNRKYNIIKLLGANIDYKLSMVYERLKYYVLEQIGKHV